MDLNKALLFNLQELQSAVNHLSDQEYTEKMEILSGSSIGQHYRHLIEFLLCLKESLINGKVNYDARERDLEIENSRLNSLQKIESIKAWISSNPENCSLNLESVYGYDEPELVVINTDLQRELVYNLEHCVHHMALIKIGFRKLNKHQVLSAYFGVASSTSRHQQATKA